MVDYALMPVAVVEGVRTAVVISTRRRTKEYADDSQLRSDVS